MKISTVVTVLLTDPAHFWLSCHIPLKRKKQKQKQKKPRIKYVFGVSPSQMAPERAAIVQKTRPRLKGAPGVRRLTQQRLNVGEPGPGGATFLHRPPPCEVSLSARQQAAPSGPARHPAPNSAVPKRSSPRSFSLMGGRRRELLETPRFGAAPSTSPSPGRPGLAPPRLAYLLQGISAFLSSSTRTRWLSPS